MKKKITVMTKMERIAAAIRGDAVDTVPYSLWSHLPLIDLDPVKNAEQTYGFYKTYDVDILKTMNNGMYSVEDFGAVADYSEIAGGGVAKIISTPVHRPKDWLDLEPVSVNAGALAREQEYLRLLLDKTRGEVPVIFTVIEMGADGIFFATQLSSYAAGEESFYREYGMPYDLAVLSASSGWCNVLHAHGKDIMFPLLRKYPVQIFNWHAWESLPEIGEAQALTGKCIMAGLERMDITGGRKNEIEYRIYETLRQTGGRKIILSPGCVIRYPLNEEILAFVRKAKNEIEEKLLKTR